MEETIEKFYTAFAKRDWQTMQSCYHKEASFTDPVFQNLSAKETKAMLHMLAEAAKELTVTYNSIKINGEKGTCHWDAFYNFSKTGRNVHNKISASFQFKEGKILSHRDEFDLWKWSGMALGAIGLLFGWTPYIQNKIRKTARKGLAKFIETHPEYQ